jgi:exopolysaccharide biosynthesis polyprenyl glycosylphosphotransferase
MGVAALTLLHTAVPTGLLLTAVPALGVSLAVHGFYRGNGLRMTPTGIPVVSAVARSLPLALVAVVGVLLAGVPAIGVRAIGLAAAVLLPALASVPAARSAAAGVGRRFRVGRSQQVLIVGAGEAADAVSTRLQRYGGIDVIGMVDDDPLPGFETVGRVADIADICHAKRVDRIIVALPRTPWLAVSEALQPLIGAVDIAVVPSLHELMTWRSGTQDLAGMPLVPLVGAQKGWLARIAKRAVDLVIGTIALLLLSPVLVVAMIAIRVDSKGPVFFRQQRMGRGNRPFTILKLRTMRLGADGERAILQAAANGSGSLFKMAEDPRVTRTGSLLRRFSIDELPQLLNVLSGTMSLVGPRPYPMDESEALQVGPAASRFEMLPGMTGLWQVSGRSDLSWDDLCRLDAIYVRSWSLTWDLRILLQTPAAVLRSQGAY